MSRTLEAVKQNLGDPPAHLCRLPMGRHGTSGRSPGFLRGCVIFMLSDYCMNLSMASFSALSCSSVLPPSSLMQCSRWSFRMTFAVLLSAERTAAS